MSKTSIGIAYPRAALIGNPSDGFGGMTIAFVFSDYQSEVKLEQHNGIQLIPGKADYLEWDNISHFHSSVKTMGYYGGLRLLKAALHVFFSYCLENRIDLNSKGFRLSYSTNIPQLLGLSGSSAIISACLRALTNWYGVKLKPWQLADLAWRVETEELGIPAGLQDRVAQAYDHPVFMDFHEDHFSANSYGNYEKVTQKLQNIYIAFSSELAEGSEKTHTDLRERFEAGDTQMLESIESWRDLTLKFREALVHDDIKAMSSCINTNFDIRNALYDLHPKQAELVRLARKSGASAKFCGSGGAIIGIYENEAMLQRLTSELNKNGVNILLPNIVYSE
ncbi:MAG: hypothetical protein JKX84_02350 [Flavobacteriales bacterium]|nr:hypothetical protein [Flavobacteriales bacterium]